MIPRPRVDDDIPGLRPAADADSAALITLIGGCFAEYPGCVLDLPGVDAWMSAPATSYAEHGGDIRVVERDGAVVACVGWRADADGTVELKNLYVGAAARRQGMGARLVALVEHAAAVRGASAVTLWTDTRFADAHRLYERLGYVRGPETRDLHDPSDTTEYSYRRALA